MLVTAAALLTVAPAAGQGGHAVWYDGVGFAFPPALGQSVNITQVRDRPADQLTGADLAHVSFTLYGARDPGARPPAVGGPAASPREIRVYRTAVLEAVPELRDQVAALRRLLEERPDPASLSTIEGPVRDPLPVVPPITEAARIVQARAHFIDTPELSGIAYVASYAQDTLPPTSDDLLWMFQGLSADGSTHIAITWGLTTDLLPKELPEGIFRRIDRDWDGVLGESTGIIERGAANAFRPDLDALDALVRSMVLPGGPSSQVPEASPAT